jgi:hypothetical protein
MSLSWGEGEYMKKSGMLVIVCLLSAALGCGSSNSNGGDTGTTAKGGNGGSTGTTATGGSSGTTGMVMSSCFYSTNQWCIQLLIPDTSSAQAAEQKTCTSSAIEAGTIGTGCPTANLAGCCKPVAGNASEEENCYYAGSSMLTAGEMACTTGGRTWSPTM